MNGGTMNNENDAGQRDALAGAPDAALAVGLEPGATDEPSPVGKAVRSIAIVGMAPAAIQEIPRLPVGTEVWTLNVGPLAFVGGRWTRHYEVHDLDWLKDRRGNNVAPYIDWLSKPHKKDIYVPRVDDRIPASVQYPLFDIVSRYGRFMPDGRPVIYFQSTVDWMLAHAISELTDEATAAGRPVDGQIHLLGVDMGLDLEYMYQRPSLEHWLGVALGAGIELNVPQSSDILQCAFPYGLETYEPRAKKLLQRRNELEAQVNEAAATEQSARDKKMALRGALDDLNYVTQGRY